jgi:hypothetical protein
MCMYQQTLIVAAVAAVAILALSCVVIGYILATGIHKIK